MILNINKTINTNYIPFCSSRSGFRALFEGKKCDSFEPSKKINPIRTIPEIKEAGAFVDDSIINNYIDSLRPSHADEALNLLNAVNSANNKYTVLRWTASKNSSKFSPYGEFDNFLRGKQNTSVSEMLENHYLPDDILDTFYDFVLEDYTDCLFDDLNTNIRYAPLQKYFEDYPDSPVCDYLYENVYLNSYKKEHPNVHPSHIELCKDINKKYGTKVFLSSYTDSMYDILSCTDKEFALWYDAGGKNVKYPKTIDFSLANSMWYDNEAAYGTSRAMAAAGDSSLYLSLFNEEMLAASLRHEMTHYNKQNKDKPWHLVTSSLYKDERLKYELFNQKKYYDEFLNAGMPSYHADYAYNNADEFIAVASEGDMSVYSDEFKQILVKMGMPKWQLNLKQNDYFNI